MTNSLPFNITRYLYDQWTERTFFAYILVDRHNHPIDWSDNFSSLYNINLDKNKNAEEQLLFLHGFLPCNYEQAIVLDAVNFPTGRSADIHLVPSKDELCVLLFDVTESTKLRQELQQKTNEIKLLYEQELQSMRTLKQSYHELQRQKEFAESANRAKSEFLRQISHDLKSPLNGILGFAQLLELSDEALSAEANEYVQEIKNSGGYLLSLINNLLDIAKIESGSIKINPELLTVSTLIKESINLLRPIAEKNKIAFINRMDASLPLVWVDPMRFRQVIINILSNAIKYNRENGCIIISSYINNHYSVRINVKDTGIGIDQAELYKVFLPFERGAAEHTEIEGTGIGLSVCKQLIELMQGTIDVYSDIGAGSLFWLEIPLANEQIAKIQPQNRLQTILYIGKNQVYIDLMCYFLEQRSNYTLLNGQNMPEILELVNNHPISTILLDTDMAALDYLEVFQILQSQEKSKNIPIIGLFNANANLIEIKATLNAGFYDYMTKPFDFNLAMELFDRLAAVQ